MPIKPTSEETEQEFISRCMSVEKEMLPEQDQRLAVCYSYWDKKDMSEEVSEEAQQGGVVGSSFSRTKFEYPPKGKEKMNDFMSRCMSDSVVREKKPSRTNRAAFCYRMYEDFYVMSIGTKWK